MDSDYGYGDLENSIEVNNMKHFDETGKKKYIKKLWEDDPKSYFEWKDWCIKFDRLPDFFGTKDHPIPIDESKL